MTCHSKTDHGGAMSDTRTIARVVFTATGEMRTPKKGEWFQLPDGHIGEISLCTRDGSGDKKIYTIEVFYAPQAPLNEVGQADPDLRERMLSSISDPSTRFIFEAVIDRLEAQKVESEKLRQDLSCHRITVLDLVVKLHKRIEALEGLSANDVDSLVLALDRIGERMHDLSENVVGQMMRGQKP